MTEEFANYETSFFVMSIPTEADINICKMSDRDFAVFFHEYIHFLQDITSFYGYSSIYSHGEYMRKVLNIIYNCQGDSFTVPIDIHEDTDIVWLNKQISYFSLGDMGDISIVSIKDVNADIFIERLPLNSSFSIPELHVKALTNKGVEEFIVGAYAIRENMAYLLERTCTTSYQSSCEFPYQIVEILANSMCPGVLSNEDLIALCDVSLQCSVPGYGLYQYLKAISIGNLIINKPEDFYDNFFSQQIDFLGKKQSTSSALEMASKIAIDHLSSYVKIDSLKEEYTDWVDFTFKKGLELRISHRYFFLKMARDKRDKDNKVLQMIARTVGSPQMVNAKGLRYQLATTRPICRFEYFEAVREIERLFETGSVSCRLKPWCRMSPNGAPVDNRCDKAPWTRCNDVALCPYGLLWRHWNLANKTVIYG